MNKRRSWARRLLGPVIGRGRGIVGDEKGAVAVEFGLLALPFFAFIFAIIETSMMFFAQQVLESALQDATRFIRTGQSQTGALSWDQAAFRAEVCGNTFGMLDCSGTNAGRLWVRVIPVTTFNDASAANTKPISSECNATVTDPATCNWSFAESFDDGKGSDVIMAQAFYKWPTLVNLPFLNLANQAGGNRLLSAVRVFKNEPF